MNFSIIVPTRNRPEELKRLLDSYFAGNYRPEDELMIIHDAPSMKDQLLVLQETAAAAGIDLINSRQNQVILPSKSSLTQLQQYIDKYGICK